ncbi:MAG TPA: hypothetical protein VEX60_05780 [Pyrinomonadaceae bacterium]|nr:hypothetical protein [Pyrinomonadaceae bacterium]
MKRHRIILFLLIALSFGVQASAHPATGIVVDRQGRVYFSDLETVWRLDAGGRLTVFRASEGGRHVHELTIDDEDNVYGGDISYAPATKKWISAVWRMSPAGQMVWLVTPTENDQRDFSIHSDRAGSTYFIEQNNHTKRKTLLLKRTASGEVSTFAGGAYGHADGRGTEAKFGSIGGITFARDGAIYLTDSTSLRRVSPDGTVRTIATNLNVPGKDDSKLSGGLSASLMGLTVDASENVFIADHGNRRVLKITPDGKSARVLRAEPPWSPTGVAAAPDGSVLVLETSFTLPNIFSGPRVRRLMPDGTVKTIATVGAKEKTASRMTTRQSAASGASDNETTDAGETADAYEKNVAKVERGVAVYFGLGFLAIVAVAGLSSFVRR